MIWSAIVSRGLWVTPAIQTFEVIGELTGVITQSELVGVVVAQDEFIGILCKCE